jgi:thiamine biosynthesis lipoprotein
LVSLLALTACASVAAAEISRTELVIGTVCSVRLIEGGTAKTADEIFARLKKIEDTMSANKDGTEIAAVNSGAGGAPVKVSADTFYVIKKALEYAALTGGAFDPTVGPLVKLWDIGGDNPRIPQKQEIAAALKLIDYRTVQLDQAASTVRLPVKGMKLDLGAIAKGYAADEVELILERHNVKSAVVDLGGNVLVFGKKKDGTPWRVGIQDPKSTRGEYLGLVTGEAMTVVTSGIYERFFIENGVRYHHILDTKTGFPVSNGLVSVSIITTKSIDADGLSTSLFALGREKGLALVKTMPGVFVVFVDDKDKVYLSPGTEKMFKLTNSEYRMGN